MSTPPADLDGWIDLTAAGTRIGLSLCITAPDGTVTTLDVHDIRIDTDAHPLAHEHRPEARVRFDTSAPEEIRAFAKGTRLYLPPPEDFTLRLSGRLYPADDGDGETYRVTSG